VNQETKEYICDAMGYMMCAMQELENVYNLPEEEKEDKNTRINSRELELILISVIFEARSGEHIDTLLQLLRATSEALIEKKEMEFTPKSERINK
jgi:hypothetical protein